VTKRLRPNVRQPEDEQAATIAKISSAVEEQILDRIISKVTEAVQETLRSAIATGLGAAVVAPPVAHSQTVPPPLAAVVDAESPAPLQTGENPPIIGHIANIVNPSSNTCSSSSSTQPVNLSVASPSTPRPLNSISVPVASFVTDKIKSRIWSNEFISFSQLVQESDERDDTYSLQLSQSDGTPTLQRRPTARKSKLHMTQWLSAWNRFSAIYLLQHPSLAGDIAKHFETVRAIFSKGGDWHQYDESFRTEIAHGRVCWGQPHLELYLQTMSSKSESYNKPQSYQKSAFNNNRGSNTGKLPFGTRIPPGACFRHHRGLGCSEGNNCKFQHGCVNCSMSHPLVNCTQPLKQPFRVHPRFSPSPGQTPVYSRQSTELPGKSSQGRPPTLAGARPANTSSKPYT
jgi:hypothetical protein